MLKAVITVCLLVSILMTGTTLMAAPILVGEFTQGSLVRGKIAPNSQVYLNDKPVATTENGDFVIGFGRDADSSQILSWQLPNTDEKQSKLISLSKRTYKIDRINGVASKYVSPPESVLTRIRSDSAAVAKARAIFTQSTDFTSNFIMPAKGRISGVYGSRRVFNGEPKRPHYGLDIANKTGTAVIAPVGGIVRLAHNDMYYSGGTLIIDHGLGVSSTFMHLSKLHVQEGQRIEQGDLIAEIGATGRVTGPHLDWRINWFKERLDPALLVDLPSGE